MEAINAFQLLIIMQNGPELYTTAKHECEQ